MTGKVIAEVGKSVQNAVWYLPNINPENEQQISLQHSLPVEVASFLSAKDIPLEKIEDFLNPSIKTEMIDPSLFKDMDKIVSFLADGIMAGKTFGIFGDYDVDGATSTALMVKYFNALGIKSVYHIPDRENEGYGANINGFEKLVNAGADIIICVDCGTTSFDVMATAKAKNIDVVVIDHHITDSTLPEVVALVNPNRFDDESGMGGLCAVAVCFFVLTALNRELRNNNFFNNTEQPNLLNYLDLVALGTVCDVMELTGINRAFVAQGLKVMQKRTNLGLAKLADIAGVKEKIKSFHLGFALGPRLNAGGRMGNGRLATEILLCDDGIKITELVEMANNLNKTRQDSEANILNEIEAKIDNFVRDKFVFAYGENWNEGVVGICASRLKEKHNKPSFVATIKNGICKGSVRSVAGIDVGTILVKATQLELLQSGGGHKMAGGFSLSADKVEEFIEYLTAEINTEIAPKSYYANKITSVSSLNPELCKKMAMLEPYGMGNGEPKFIIKDVLISSYKIVGEKHISCYVKDSIGGTGVNVISFNSVDNDLGNAIMKTAKNKPISMLGKVKLDTWNGNEKVSFVLEDIAI